MEVDFSNSAATRACMFKFSTFYLQWFQSYGQQFISLALKGQRDVDCLADKERLILLLSGGGVFYTPTLHPPDSLFHPQEELERC